MALIIKFPGRPFNWSDAQHRAAGNQLPFAVIKKRADTQRSLSGCAKIFKVRKNDRPWAKSEQQRPLAGACERARIDPPINFHGLRHTYASRLAMRGVPLAVIAAQLGHSDTRMVEKHYGHLAPNYVADTVRTAFGRLGIVEPSNIISMASDKAGQFESTG